MANQSVGHILQKKGILRSFSVAKIVNSEEIKELQELIKTVATSKKEYKQLLKEELAKLSDMNDKKNPIPGIIQPDALFIQRKLLFTVAHRVADTIKKNKFTKKELAFIISAIISRLELSQDDFTKLNEELESERDEENEENEENEN